MKFFRRYWYCIGLAAGTVCAIWLFFSWKNLGVIQRLLFLNFIFMTIHQFEEFGFPGGVPYLFNEYKCKSPHPDRYPQNQNQVMIGNVITTYVFYLLPAFFPEQIWFGLGGILVGLFQITAHLEICRTIKYFYGPGNFAVFCGHIPIGIYFIYYGMSNHLISTWDWLGGILVFLFIGAFLVGFVGYKLLADENSKYPFSYEEMHRPWARKRVESLKNKKL